MEFTSRIKSLNKGTIRLLIALSILLSIVLFIIGIVENEDGLTIFSFFSFFIFWVIVWVVLWIKDGYKEDK